MSAPFDRVGARQVRPDASDASLRTEVLDGLLSTPKTLPAKLFYDARGAALFERICTLPEYYLTRNELAILAMHVHEIARLAGPRPALVEYGSGAGVKVRLLLDTLDSPTAYVPIDISREQLAAVSREIAADYPGIEVHPVWADYTQPLVLPPLPDGGRLAFFPGSTIGNFHPTAAAAFLRRIRRTLGADGAMVLGVDSRKSLDLLLPAYNDAEGVTAEFNLNMLRRLNRDFGADFDLGAFEHRAIFDEEASRIEMHLVSRADQCVRLGNHTIHFERGESIWTESSYKYDRASLEALVTTAGFRLERVWTDETASFWVCFLRG